MICKKGMKYMKHKFKRISSLIVALAMIISMIPGFTLTAHAGGSLNTISGLTAIWTDASNSSGSASWSARGTSITGTATGYKQVVIPKTVTTNLTLTNSSGSEATLSFDYTLEGDDGSVEGISGNSYSGVLANDASLTITLTSPKGDKSNTLRITGLSLISTSAGAVTTTFKPVEGGSYTVAEGSGTAEEITAETAKTGAAGTEYTVSATAASGYQFFGWYNETTGAYLDYTTPYTFKATADMTLVPKFVSDTTAVFGVGGAKFTDLTEAGTYAAAGTVKTIVLLNDGTVSGSHTIPAGTTLLIPFDDANTLYTTTPETTSTKGTVIWELVRWEKPTAYRTMTLAADANITVNGAISLSAKHAAGSSAGNAGSPSGPCSFMNMTAGSRITLNSGAALYAWGYVTGSGTITAKPGSKVYENFQIRDFRGGNATSAMAYDLYVFPLSQYYVQNVEVPITYESGAEEWVYTSLYMSKRVFSASVKFVGSGAMFQPQEGGSVTKTYIGSSDRLKIDVRGDANLSSIALSLNGTDINSANFILPINSNIDINILSGTTSLSQDLALLPGSAMSVAQGATLKISYTASPSGIIESGKGYNLFVYDADEWTYGYDGNLNRVDDVKYVHSGYRLMPLSYAPSRTYNRTESDLKDVVIDVNGTITTNGFLFTTAGGANIISSGKTGKIVMVNGAGTEEYTYQATQIDTDITYYAIPVTSAQLRNGDGTYTETAGAAAGDTYVYNVGKDKWVKDGETEEITITFDANGGDGSMDPQTANSGEDAVLTGNSFTREHYTFKEWNTAQDGSGTSYENGATVNFTENTTLYAIWVPETYTVIWKNTDGTILETDEAVPYGTMPQYNGATPTKESTNEQNFTFKGWTPAITKVTGDVTYTAEYTDSTRYYNVIWYGADDRIVAQLSTATYGANILQLTEQNGVAAPTKEAEIQYTYTFDHWVNKETNEKITAESTVTDDTKLTPVFKQEIRKYTITWQNEDGTVIDTTEVEYNQMPSHDAPVKEGGEYYSYIFAGWTPALDKVTKDATYKAKFTYCGDKHTVTFDANGGEGSMAAQTFEYGVTETLTANSFNRANFKFTGWSTARDGSGATYADKGSITYLTKDITLYAQWQIWSGWYTDTVGTTYYKEGEQPYKNQWATIDGNTYYFNEKSYIVKGLYKTTSQDDTYEAMFVFDDTTGIFLSDKSGLHDVGADTYWIQNGEVVEEAGLQRVVTETGEVNYYYFAVQKNVEENPDLEVTKAVKNLLPEGGRDCWIYETNDLPLPEWGYYFDENGVILHDPDTSKKGIQEEEGVLYYYVDGIKAPAGLIKIEDDYYYANSKGQLIVDQTYYCSRTNGLLPEGTYAFNEKGKMMIGDTNKKGIVEENGSLYYYVDGQLTYAGLIKIDEDYYYVKSNCEVVHGQTYWISWTHGIMDAGYYTFDDNGKMLPNKNGIVYEDGSQYYYANGTRVYAGLIQIEDAYYYVKSNCEVVHGCSYWISKTNGLLPEGRYSFAEDGKLQLPEKDETKDGIVPEDGSLYYYANGMRTYAGLIIIDGDYYYVNSQCEVVHGRTYYISLTHGLLPQGVYTFDDTGKMIVN